MSAVASAGSRAFTRNRGLFFVGLVVAVLVVVIVLPLVFAWPRAERESDELNVGSVDRYAIGSLTAMTEGDLYLLRVSERSFAALSRSDPVSGCTVPWRSNQGVFRDPCSGSTYGREGRWLGGATGSPNLHRYRVSIINGDVIVDTGQYVCGFEPPGEPCEMAPP